MKLHIAHRCSAAIIGAFALVHLGNHLAALGGAEAHIALMQTLRHGYRHPLVEPVLLACVAFQALSGARLVLHQWRLRRGLVPWLQAGTGAFMAVFLLLHTGAVMYGRWAAGLDTNFWFAAAGMHAGLAGAFVPYYFLAVLALFTHVACFAFWRCWHLPPARRRLVVAIPAATGAIVGLLIVGALAGWWFQVQVPPAYLALYARP